MLMEHTLEMLHIVALMMMTPGRIFLSNKIKENYVTCNNMSSKLHMKASA